MEKQILSTVADLMALSARTAPKAKGSDFVVMKKFEGDELLQLADELERQAGLPGGKAFFVRDANNLRGSGAALLIGLRDAASCGLNCGGCGYDTCAELMEARKGPEFKGPFCAIRQIDLGIAVGSAARTAMQHTADSRVMYSVGAVAVKAGLFDADIAMGIPLSASGKSPYFDRK